jgi:hypothetical protein
VGITLAKKELGRNLHTEMLMLIFQDEFTNIRFITSLQISGFHPLPQKKRVADKELQDS